LGRTFCHALADRGAAIAVADINPASAAVVAAEIVERGGRAFPVQVDIADPDSTKAMADTVYRELGKIAVLVNNAALFSTLTMRTSFIDLPIGEWRKVMDVNVTGTYLCCRAVVPQMIEAGYGKIINISSATIWTGRPGYLHYVTSKSALIGFTRALAAELGEAGIRVNAITPGSTQTEIGRETISLAAREAMARSTALRRIQVPNDLAGAIVFLASTDSDFITGQTINVDGGFAYH
jgi:3-oxoacyl-[acyl-carrier protein] reductase